MLLVLLSLGGIPFVTGFWAELYVFWAAAQVGLYWLVVLGAVLTVVAALRVTSVLFCDRPQSELAYSTFLSCIAF